MKLLLKKQVALKQTTTTVKVPMKNPLAPLLTLLFLASLGCVRTKSAPLDELALQHTGTQSYTAQPGDLLLVRVWSEPQLSGEMLIREDGKFTMPLIQDVEAGGRSLDEISKDISTRLQSYVPAASVSVSVAQAAPTRYYLSGSFLRPGEYRSATSVSFLQAVASGGGFAPFADDSSITLVRQATEGEKRYLLDYQNVIAGKEPNPLLKSGDVIAVE